MRIVVLFFLFSSFSLFGQKEDVRPSIIHYDDGSVYVGRIIKNSTAALTIVNAYNDTLVLKKKHVTKIKDGGKIKLTKNRKFHFYDGNYFELVYGADGGINSNGVFLDFGVGKRVKENLSVGLGLGILSEHRIIEIPNSMNQWIWLDNGFVPVQAYGQYYLSDWNARPYIKQHLGYSFGLRSQWNSIDRVRGGFYSRSGFGFHFASKSRFKYYLEIHQVVHKSSGSGSSLGDFGNPINFEFDIWSHRVGMTVGARFF